MTHPSDNSSIPDDLLTVEEVAKILKISPELVRRHIREGRLRATKVGKFWRVLRKNLDILIRRSDEYETVIQPTIRKSSVDACSSRKRNLDFEIGESRRMAGVRKIDFGLDERRMLNESERIVRYHQESPLIKEIYSPIEQIITDFEARNRHHSVHVEVNEEPLWEVCFLRQKGDLIFVTKYITTPGKSNTVAVIENILNKGGDVRKENLEPVQNFKSFVKWALSREEKRMQSGN